MNIKSYITFLSRNKVYTAINVFGLSISLMFVMLIGVYVWQEYRVTRDLLDSDRIEVIGMNFAGEKYIGTHHYVGKQLLNLKSATIIQYTIKGRFMSR